MSVFSSCFFVFVFFKGTLAHICFSQYVHKRPIQQETVWKSKSNSKLDLRLPSILGINWQQTDEQEKKWALKLTVAATVTVNLMMAQVTPVTGDTHDKKCHQWITSKKHFWSIRMRLRTSIHSLMLILFSPTIALNTH